MSTPPIGRRFEKGRSGNPGGKRPKTDDQRAAETYLRDRTLAAAQRLVQLQASDDEKIALGAVTAHLKLTIGELERGIDETPKDATPPLTNDERRALLKAQLAAERESLPVVQAVK